MIFLFTNKSFAKRNLTVFFVWLLFVLCHKNQHKQQLFHNRLLLIFHEERWIKAFVLSFLILINCHCICSQMQKIYILKDKIMVTDSISVGIPPPIYYGMCVREFGIMNHPVCIFLCYLDWNTPTFSSFDWLSNIN